MKFHVQFTRPALDHLNCLSARDRTILVEAITQRLVHEPTTPTRHRKRLRPNVLAEWELRVGDFRVYYVPDEELAVVSIVAIGEKRGSRIIIAGKEFIL